VGFVVIVYVAVVVRGWGLLGLTATPSLWLSVLATAMVAIGFGPVQAGVERSLSGALPRDRMSPYQVLAHFPKTATGAHPAVDLPVRMVRVLAEGTGTARAELWLAVKGRLELAAVGRQSRCTRTSRSTRRTPAPPTSIPKRVQRSWRLHHP